MENIDFNYDINYLLKKEIFENINLLESMIKDLNNENDKEFKNLIIDHCLFCTNNIKDLTNRI